MKIILKIIIGILFWATYFLPIYSFEKAFKIPRVNATNFFGAYPYGVLTYSTLAIVLTLLFIRITPLFFQKLIYKISIVICYLVFYYFACISIAWDYRIIFGTTWQWSEIFTELVKPQWYFYVFGVLGVFFNYQFQKLLYIKTI